MSENLHLRKVEWRDKDILYTWRNDIAVRVASFHREKISLTDHKAWLVTKLEDPSCSMYILESKNEPVGQVRIDRHGKEAYISYSICSGFRGQGYGKLMLELLENEVAEESLVLVGQVKKDNVASQVIFQTLGYKEKEEEEFFEYRKTACSVPLGQTNVSSGG